MTPLIIYHSPCNDGFGAAYAAWLKFGSDAEYMPTNYGKGDYIEIINNAHGGVNRDVYILDFSIPNEQMRYLRENAQRVVWLDHHKTAFEAWGVKNLFDLGNAYVFEDERCKIVLDAQYSGAFLAWNHFHPGKPTPVLLQYIQDNDLWHHKLPDCKSFIRALRSHETTFENWNDLAVKLENAHALREHIAEGQAIERFFQQQLEMLLEETKRPICLRLPEFVAPNGTTPVDVVEGLSVNINTTFTSEAGALLSEESKTFGLMWYQEKEGRVHVSLRSRGSYDVSAIAKVFGGGGHRNSAGFSCSMEQLQEWLL